MMLISRPPSELADIFVLPIFIVLAPTYRDPHLNSGEPKLKVSFCDGNIFPDTTILPDIVLLTINLLLVPAGIISAFK